MDELEEFLATTVKAVNDADHVPGVPRPVPTSERSA